MIEGFVSEVVRCKSLDEPLPDVPPNLRGAIGKAGGVVAWVRAKLEERSAAHSGDPRGGRTVLPLRPRNYSRMGPQQKIRYHRQGLENADWIAAYHREEVVKARTSALEAHHRNKLREAEASAVAHREAVRRLQKKERYRLAAKADTAAHARGKRSR